MAVRGDGRPGDLSSRGHRHGPPPPAQPRTWQSVEEARAQRRSGAGRKGGKARAKRDRARAAERAGAVAAERRAALSRQQALREAQLRREQRARSVQHEPVRRPMREAAAGLTTRMPRPRLPTFRLPSFRLPSFRLPTVRPPTVRPPTVRLPTFRFPRLRFPRLRPSVRLPTLRFPRLRLPSIRLPALRPPALRRPTVRRPRPATSADRPVAPAPPILPVPGTVQTATRAPAGSSAQAPWGDRVRSRAWLATGLAAGVIVAVGMGVGVVAVADRIDSWTTDVGAEQAGRPAPSPAPAPASAPATGDFVQSSVDADGRLSTEHWIARSKPIRELTVEIRPDGGLTPDTAVLQSLAVTADGRELPDAADQLVNGSLVNGSTVDLPDGTRSVRLRYVTGSVVQQTGSTSPARALVLINPLQVQVGVEPASDPAVVRLAGDDVLSLACVGADRVPQPCGRPDQSGWRVRLDQPRATGVVAQVDLPTG